LRLTVAAAQLLCLALAALDVWARAWRYVLLLRGLKAKLGLRGSLVLTIFGDAVAGITPMRLGGEPARILGARHDGVPVGRAITALALENVLTYSILIPAAAFVGARYGSDWWHTIAPRLDARLIRWVIVGFIATAIVMLALLWWLRTRSTRDSGLPRREGFRELVHDLITFPPWLLLLCLVASAMSLFGRVGILPVLAMTTPEPPPLGAAIVASLGLLYGQLVVPTPSGAGPIDVAVLAGASGVTSGAGHVLGAWRLYTTILPIVVGLVAGFLAYGRSVLSLLTRARR
jgi:uncharacterized membrane protein YbhN (UPF0104 family)